MAMQSVLHALFLPTPLKRALAHAYASVDASMAASEKAANNEAAMGTADTKGLRGDLFTEVAKPGALYRECSVITLSLPPLPPNPEATTGRDSKGSQKKKTEDGTDELLVIEEDGEYGGESIGRVVWEWYEKKLKVWEASEPQDPEPQAEDTVKESS